MKDLFGFAFKLKVSIVPLIAASEQADKRHLLADEIKPGPAVLPGVVSGQVNVVLVL